MSKKGLIYCYKYLPNNKCYIGQTTNFKKRQKQHLLDTRHNLQFHNLLREHYEDFEISILQDNINIEDLNDKEKYYIKLYNSFDENGFNLTSGGEGGFQACHKYWQTHPEELKLHIKKIQPLAVKAVQEWRQNNPKLEQQRLNNLHKAAQQWRQNNPESFQNNLIKAQEAAREWRKRNPEKAQENLKKATKANCKKVRLKNTGKIFISASQAGRQYNIPASNISACCRGVRKSAGKDQNKNKLIWEYINE